MRLQPAVVGVDGAPACFSFPAFPVSGFGPHGMRCLSGTQQRSECFIIVKTTTSNYTKSNGINTQELEPAPYLQKIQIETASLRTLSEQDLQIVFQPLPIESFPLSPRN